MPNIIPSTPFAAQTNTAIKQILKGDGDRLYAWDGQTAQYIPDPKQLAGLVAAGFKDTRAPLSQYQPSSGVSQNPSSLFPGLNTQPQQPPAVTPQDPLSTFNIAILDMLKQAQTGGQAGNESLFAQQTALQRAAIDRTAQPTPADLQVLSPSQQSAIRSGNVRALEPELDAVGAKIKAQDARLQNFESVLGQLKTIGQDLAKINPSEDVINGYVNMLKAGGNLTSVPQEVRDKVVKMMTDDDWKANALASQKSSNDISWGPIGQDQYGSTVYGWIDKANQQIIPGMGGTFGSNAPIQGNFSGGAIQIPQSARLAFVNNNPGNLKFAGQAGATMGEGGFARFSSPEAGYQAIKNQIELDKSRNMSLDAFITKYAPPTENDTASYIMDAHRALGLPLSSMSLARVDTNKLARFIAQKESSTIVAEQPQSSQQAVADVKVLSNALDIAKGFLSTPQRRSADISFNQALSEGNIDQAKMVVKSVALNAMPVDQNNRVTTRESLFTELATIQQGLSELQTKYGISTNFLTGTEQDVLQRIGKTVSPQAQYLQTRILNDVIAFRRAATGVQFSQKESEQYSQMFPRLGAEMEVNKANIAALNDSMVNEIRNVYGAYIGNSNFDKLFKDDYKISSFGSAIGSGGSAADILRQYGVTP